MPSQRSSPRPWVPRNAVNPYVTQSHLSSAKRLVRKGTRLCPYPCSTRTPNFQLGQTPIHEWSRINVLPVRLDTGALVLDTLVWSQVVKGLSGWWLDQIWLKWLSVWLRSDSYPRDQKALWCVTVEIREIWCHQAEVMCNRTHVYVDSPIRITSANGWWDLNFLSHLNGGVTVSIAYNNLCRHSRHIFSAYCCISDSK